MPIALMACSLFAAFTLAFVPFAYLYATFFKIMLFISTTKQPKDESNEKPNGKAVEHSKRSSDEIGKDLLVFIIMGVPILLVAWTLDCYHFLVHIYRSDISNYAVVSQREFIMTEQ